VLAPAGPAGKPRRARQARPCACQRDIRKTRRAASSGIPPRYGRCTLENFQPAAPGQTRALAAARELAGLFPGHEKGLLLYGGAGVGKTHLAAALGGALLARGAAVRFVEYGELLDAIKAGFDDHRSEGEIVGEYESAPVLILDDLASRRVTDWALDVLTRIIDHRYSRNPEGLLIVTTNRGFAGGAPPPAADAPPPESERDRLRAQLNRAAAPPAATPRRAAPAGESLDELLNERLISRLHALCRILPVDGPDRRRAE
jgi:DNA replication protein DnaC